jgi:hypothetical protein
MRFVKASVQAITIISASVLAEKGFQKPKDESKEKLREYLAQNQPENKPVVEPKGSDKQKRMCSVSVI